MNAAESILYPKPTLIVGFPTSNQSINRCWPFGQKNQEPTWYLRGKMKWSLEAYQPRERSEWGKGKQPERPKTNKFEQCLVVQGLEVAEIRSWERSARERTQIQYSSVDTVGIPNSFRDDPRCCISERAFLVNSAFHLISQHTYSHTLCLYLVCHNPHMAAASLHI
jgi:hypothetical protein